MSSFEIKNINPEMIYIAWKIITSKVRQDIEYPHCFRNVMYNIKDRSFNVDDFLEIKKTKAELFLFFLTSFIRNGFISEIRIIVVDDNDLYNPEGGNDNFLKKEIDITIDKKFIDSNNYVFPSSLGGEKDSLTKMYDLFISGYSSMKETCLIKGFDYKKIPQNYHTYFVYKPNIEDINEYIEKYLLLWGNEQLNPAGNYIKPGKQIQYFRKNLIDHINNFGDEFTYKIGTNSNLDEVTLILYFNITGYILLEEFDDGVDRIIGLENTTIHFKIKILQKFYDDFTKKEGLDFDEKSGKVVVDGTLIGTIPINTQPYFFFKFLYDNRGAYKTHTEIKEYIKGKEQIQKKDDEFCRNVKNELPNSKIKKIIKPQKKLGYLIP